jgi:hypothetical protein
MHSCMGSDKAVNLRCLLSAILSFRFNCRLLNVQQFFLITKSNQFKQYYLDIAAVCSEALRPVFLRLLRPRALVHVVAHMTEEMK